MAYDTTEAVAKFLSGFQMKITERERDTVAPDYYVKYLLTLSKGGKDFSTTCDIDPEAVSVDSEAHDMENGRDGLDGNAPEKDAPEKDNRDAQPPVDTDNR